MKAIVLLSGGLDSSLALKMIHDQGIDVLALHFSSSFSLGDGLKGSVASAQKISEFVGTRLRSVFLGEEFLDIVRYPRFGRGKNMNPCIDCRILKFLYAKKVMEEEKASFIVTGEVLGQRPMSQRKNAMNLIERESGLTGFIVRPLSARVMPPSIPEQKGWVDRELFLDLQGRNRTPQIALANEFGIKDYPSPAGGCLLTDPSFSRRIKDLLDHELLDMKSAELLKVGRHFRLTPDFKLVSGRNESENNRLIALAQPEDLIFEPQLDVPGSTGVGRGVCDDHVIDLAARIMGRYTTTETENVEIFIHKKGDSENKSFLVTKAKDEDISKVRL